MSLSPLLVLKGLEEVLIEAVSGGHNRADDLSRDHQVAKAPRQAHAVAGIEDVQRPLLAAQLIAHRENGAGAIGVTKML